MLDHNLVLKSDELFLAADMASRRGTESAAGLYLHDTRFLSHFSVSLGGQSLERLAICAIGNAEAVVILTNPRLDTGSGKIASRSIAVEEHVRLADDLQMTMTVTNHAAGRISLPLRLGWHADFRDLFDIRGFPRSRRGRIHAPVALDSGDGVSVRLAYTGLDGLEIVTDIVTDQPGALTLAAPPPAEPDAKDGQGVAAPDEAAAEFGLDLAPGEAWTITITVNPVGYPRLDGPGSAWSRGGNVARISTDHPGLNRVLERSAADLAMLRTPFEYGTLFAAGIPWFVAPFGRDSIIAALQALLVDRENAMETLRVLAAMQGKRHDPWREEEPGKILHEMRLGEMARLGEIPHTPYYGTLDATPLWLLLLAEAVAWTGNDAEFQHFHSNARRALEWMDEFGDLDGDGLLEYRVGDPDGVHIVHPVWKDSHDSLNWPDGTPVTGVVSPVEVQGYAFAACHRLAAVADRAGNTEWATELRQRAVRVRTAVEERFWLEDEGFYAQALDAEKRPVAAISSNPGHLLWCGLPSAERAARMADRLMQPDLFSGWGIRTLSSQMPTFNPMSYHNGSVWPHDNSLIVAGLARYGHVDAARQISEGLIAAAMSDPLLRLPELFCGFAREQFGDHGPVPYPVSCSPQAWAAASVPLLVSALLGLRLDSGTGRVAARPALPDGVAEVTLHDITVRGQRSTLTVRRDGDHYHLTDGPFNPESVAP